MLEMTPKQADKLQLVEIERALDCRSISHYTNLHDNRMAFIEPQFDTNNSFFQKTFEGARLQMAGKVAIITVASLGFGVAM